MSILGEWKAAGLETVLLPSGFRARGVKPSPTEVIRRRIVPYQLRAAVNSMGGRKMSDLSEVEHGQLVEARRYQLAAFIREMAPPGTEGDEGWEKVELTVDDLADLPPLDLEALDDLIMGLATAEMVTERSMLALGLLDKESAERIEKEQQEASVSGWAEFRDESGRAAAGAAGGSVEGEAEPARRTVRRADRAAARRRAAPATRGVGD